MESSSSVANTLSPFFFPTFACLLSSYNGDGVRSYEGYQVLRLNAKDDRSYEALKNMFFQEEVDFWTRPSMVSPTDILVPPQQLKSIKSFFGLIGLKYDVIYENLQYALEFEKLNYVTRQVKTDMNWNSFHRLETIHGWMDTMAEQYPSLVSVEKVGESTEGRPLKIMKISSSTGRNISKPAIWLDGGIHAREWISPATVTYIANELITQATRTRNTRLVDTFDWYIHPVMNPDGYEYTHMYDRLWRKTRSGGTPILGGVFGCCKGTDPNRNWDYQWGGKGTSKNACSQTYCGTEPASEPEVKHVQNYILTKKEIKLFLTFHSYSQLLLLPWGYDDVKADDHDEMMEVGNRALEALTAVHGTKYKGGHTVDLLYPAAGGSHDWAKAVAGIKFSYCYELRDTGRYGFVLPPSQITTTGQETFAGVKSMAEDIMAYYKLAHVRVKNENELFEINLERSEGDVAETNVTTGETFAECLCTKSEQCFLPFVPKPDLKICTEGTVRCCRQIANCSCIQLINCVSPNSPYGFCEDATVKCCDMPPEN